MKLLKLRRSKGYSFRVSYVRTYIYILAKDTRERARGLNGIVCKVKDAPWFVNEVVVRL